MNELTDTGRVSEPPAADGRTTCGLKGMYYDVFRYVASWDASLAFDDAGLEAVLAHSA
jgi:hypothetical protein